MEKQRSDTGPVRLINPEHQPLTKEKLRELSGLPLSDEHAETTVHAIHLLAKLLYELMRKNTQIHIDNQQIVNLKDSHRRLSLFLYHNYLFKPHPKW